MAAVRFKIVDTDYDTAIVYQCHGLADDGRCRRELEQVYILSRRPVLDHLTRRRIYDLVTDRLCVDIYDFVKSARGQLSERSDCNLVSSEPEEEPPVPAPPVQVASRMLRGLTLCMKNLF